MQLDQPQGAPPDDDDDQSGMRDAPPGEEGGEISHARGEFEGFGNVVWNLAQLGYNRCVPLVHSFSSSFSPSLILLSNWYDYRTRRDRTQHRVLAWNAQMPSLVTQYLQSRLDPIPPSRTPPETTQEQHVYQLLVVDMFSK
jgi:hypothetical protein